MPENVNCPNCGEEPLVCVRVVAIKELRVDGDLRIARGDAVTAGWFCQDCRIVHTEEEVK